LYATTGLIGENRIESKTKLINVSSALQKINLDVVQNKIKKPNAKINNLKVNK